MVEVNHLLFQTIAPERFATMFDGVYGLRVDYRFATCENNIVF
jgi:hypothetical protein